MNEATVLIGTRESLQRDGRRGSGADPLFVELSQGFVHQSGSFAVDGTVVDASITDFDGSQSQTPETDWAFNHLLRRLGVRVGTSTDECTALGLTNYLAEQAGSPPK